MHAGYIGIHTVICLLDEGIRVTILDSLDNASTKYVEFIQKLNAQDDQRLKLVIGDIRDQILLGNIFANEW